jgi:PAS domain S-box-containing protein
MTDGIIPVARPGQPVVVAFPGQADAAGLARAGEELLAALGPGAGLVIADLSAAAWCGPDVVDVLARACQRAAAAQAELRLAVPAPDVRRALSAAGLDRLVPVDASLAAALAGGSAAGGPAPMAGMAPWWPPRPGPGDADGASAGVSEAVLRQVIDALDDGVALADEDGTIVLASRRLAAMLGYPPGALAGQPVEALVPEGLRDAHRKERAGYALAPQARPMAHRARLVALRADGGTLPVTITLAPVPTADRHLVLAIIRDATRERQRDDLARLLAATAAREAGRSRDLLDRVVSSLFHAGLSLQAAASLPADVARERISDALQHLDTTVHEIRDHAVPARPPDGTGSGPCDPPGRDQRP